ncbi:MAG: hypothetical protein OSB34_12715 [Planktomarina sp.]|nr:hypothetical protein [Planktomarina sp.]
MSALWKVLCGSSGSTHQWQTALKVTWVRRYSYFAEFRVVCINALQGQEGNKSYHSLLSAEQLARINTLFSLSYGMPRVDDSKFVRGIIPII